MKYNIHLQNEGEKMKKVILILICLILVACKSNQNSVSNVDQYFNYETKEYSAYETGYAANNLDGFDEYLEDALNYLNVDSDIYNTVSQRYFNEAGRYVYEYRFVVKNDKAYVRYDIALEPNDSSLGYNVTYLASKQITGKLELEVLDRQINSKKIIAKALEEYGKNFDDILMIGITKIDNKNTYEVYIQNKNGQDKYEING